MSIIHQPQISASTIFNTVVFIPHKQKDPRFLVLGSFGVYGSRFYLLPDPPRTHCAEYPSSLFLGVKTAAPQMCDVALPCHSDRRESFNIES